MKTRVLVVLLTVSAHETSAQTGLGRVPRVEPPPFAEVAQLRVAAPIGIDLRYHKERPRFVAQPMLSKSRLPIVPVPEAPRGPNDAFLHVGSSAAIQLMGYGGLRAVSTRRYEASIISIAATMIAGVGKEVYDKHHGGTPSWRDLWWDAVGIGAGLVTARHADR